MNLIKYMAISLSALTLASCNFLDVEPVGKVIPETVSDYRALLTAGYSKMPKHKPLLAVRSDEVEFDGMSSAYDSYIDIFTWNDINPRGLTYPWRDFYNVIFYTNSVIKDAPNAAADAEDREQLIGEAYMLRAYMHFELLNMYAKVYDPATAASDRGIPMSLKIDIETNYKPSTVAVVYDQILADIAKGKSLMTVRKQPEATRYRFSLLAADAFEARLRLYRGEWAEALEAAKRAMADVTLQDLTLANPLIPNNFKSSESILAMEKTGSTDISLDMKASTKLRDKFDKVNDFRYALYFNKYGETSKGRNDDQKVTFRAAELYLIAAEAASNIPGQKSVAASYLKQLLEKRLSAATYTARAAEIDAMSDVDLRKAIADERARELCFEGHRWYDLKRTTREKIVKTFENKNFEQVTFTLEENDPRYVIRFPQEAIQNNPDLN